MTKIWKVQFGGQSTRKVIANNAKEAIRKCTSKRVRSYHETLQYVTEVVLIAESDSDLS